MSSGEKQFGVIINADCDIAHNKTNGNVNYLLCLTASSFVRHHLSSSIVDELLGKRARLCIERLNKVIRTEFPDLRPLDSNALIEWIKQDGSKGVQSALLSSQRIDKELVKNLDVLEICVTENASTDFEKARAAYELLFENGQEQLRQKLTEQLLNNRSFGDFLFVPDFPVTQEIGFVILLRELKFASPDTLFCAELDAKLSGLPVKHVRIGRFQDRIKYLIAQKFAFLFSRIGMPEAAERSQIDAAEMVVSEMLSVER